VAPTSVNELFIYVVWTLVLCDRVNYSNFLCVWSVKVYYRYLNLPYTL
jgi:hypothetical protein